MHKLTRGLIDKILQDIKISEYTPLNLRLSISLVSSNPCRENAKDVPGVLYSLRTKDGASVIGAIPCKSFFK